MSLKPVLKLFCPKPESSLLVNFTRLTSGNKACRFAKMTEAEMKADSILMGELGTTSFQIAQDLKTVRGGALEQVNGIFADAGNVRRVLNRSKGAVSIEPKLMKAVEKEGLSSYEEALGKIGDGIGSRIITDSLPKLKRKDIMKMIEEFKVNGESLTAKQKELLTKYIYGTKMTPAEEIEAFPLFEKFAQPLIEQRSSLVVDKLTLSIAKQRMIKDGLTIQEIESQNLLSPELIHRLKTEDIIPLQVKEINNYRGMFGLPEFSSRQIQQLRKISGEKVVVNSRADMLEAGNFPTAGYTKDEMKELAIKASGYRTAQMNVVHSNGALGEIQFRGANTNVFGEFEHIAYDLRQGKNTLGPLFDDFKSAISKLSPQQYDQYNLYLEKCYNYYNRLELGLPAKKPELPKGFDKILSEGSLRRLHNSNEARLKELKVGFEEHYDDFSAVA